MECDRQLCMNWIANTNCKIPIFARSFYPSISGWRTKRHETGLRCEPNGQQYLLVRLLQCRGATVSCHEHFWMKQLTTSPCWYIFNPCFSGSHVLFSKELPGHKSHSQGSLQQASSANPTDLRLRPQRRRFLQQCSLHNAGNSWWFRKTEFCTLPDPWALPFAPQTLACRKKSLEVNILKRATPCPLGF